jgi:hypothetical protein
MFLGTPRKWWIAAGVLFVLGLALLGGVVGGGILGGAAGLLLIVMAMIAFAAAPMRYGRSKPTPPAESAAPTAPVDTTPPAAAAPAAPSQPRAKIEAGSASEV